MAIGGMQQPQGLGHPQGYDPQGHPQGHVIAINGAGPLQTGSNARDTALAPNPNFDISQQQQQQQQLQQVQIQQQAQIQARQQQQEQQRLQRLQQQPQQQQQQQPPHMNGMSGANMGAVMPAPTPAGHQAELNYIYGMVEELSRQLADNRRVTEDIVNGLGRVRNTARSHALSNDEVIKLAADDVNAQTQNLDSLVSVLSESLERAKHSRDANTDLLLRYANALSHMLKQFHEYKSKHVGDVAAWHRSYRQQLDEARRENSRLREQIWEMQIHASRANESLRRFRHRYDVDEARWSRRVDETAVRQELRFWKRMAMPELDDDDPYWSADDDLIDSAEKARLRELELRAAYEQQQQQQQQQQPADAQGYEGDAHQQQQHQQQQHQQQQQQQQQQRLSHMGMMGGVAMQREEPQMPPRPLSAASSTGSTGR